MFSMDINFSIYYVSMLFTYNSQGGFPSSNGGIRVRLHISIVCVRNK